MQFSRRRLRVTTSSNAATSTTLSPSAVMLTACRDEDEDSEVMLHTRICKVSWRRCLPCRQPKLLNGRRRGWASARTSAGGTNARSAGARASASTSAREANARSAGGRASARTSGPARPKLGKMGFTWESHRNLVEAAGHKWCNLLRDSWACFGAKYADVLKETPEFNRSFALSELPTGTNILVHGHSHCCPGGNHAHLSKHGC